MADDTDPAETPITDNETPLIDPGAQTLPAAPAGDPAVDPSPAVEPEDAEIEETAENHDQVVETNGRFITPYDHFVFVYNNVILNFTAGLPVQVDGFLLQAITAADCPFM